MGFYVVKEKVLSFFVSVNCQVLCLSVWMDGVEMKGILMFFVNFVVVFLVMVRNMMREDRMKWVFVFFLMGFRCYFYVIRFCLKERPVVELSDVGFLGLVVGVLVVY